MKVDDVYAMFNDIKQKQFELEKRVNELETWKTRAETQLKDNDYMITALDNRLSMGR